VVLFSVGCSRLAVLGWLGTAAGWELLGTAGNCWEETGGWPSQIPSHSSTDGRSSRSFLPEGEGAGGGPALGKGSIGPRPIPVRPPPRPVRDAALTPIRSLPAPRAPLLARRDAEGRTSSTHASSGAGKRVLGGGDRR
jgi:hypothetical protein